MAKGGSSLIMQLEGKLRGANKILKDLFQQERGKYRENWAGSWSDCWNCHKPFAHGGNWNDLESTDACPYCAAKNYIQKEGLDVSI